MTSLILPSICHPHTVFYTDNEKRQKHSFMKDKIESATTMTTCVYTHKCMIHLAMITTIIIIIIILNYVKRLVFDLLK